MKSLIDNWNIKTQIWLRRIVYDRVKYFKTLCVFTFSALWHGFYPGYYLTLISTVLLTYAGRGVSYFENFFIITNMNYRMMI